MSTKAEVLAAIESINTAVQAAAKVASALTETATVTPPVVTVATPSIFANPDGSLLILTPPSIVEVRWTLVRNVEPHAWYGPLTVIPVPTSGTTIMPSYANDGDFVKIQWGNTWQHSLDGPKNTKATVILPSMGMTAPQKIVSQLLVGLNQERFNFLGTSNNGAKPNNRAYFDYYATFGINFQRFFVPVNYKENRGTGIGVTSMDQVDRILDCCQAAIMASQFVSFSAFDVLHHGPDVANWPSLLDYLDKVCVRISERGMPPDRFMVETCNEMEELDNAFWNPYRMDLHKTIRNRLPNHVISHGGGEWNSWRRFDDTWAMPPDTLVVARTHIYENRSNWSEVNSKLMAFSAKRGIPIINGEFADDFQHMSQGTNQDRWANNLIAFAETAGLLRPCLWANVGGMNDFRMNRSGVDGRLTPIMEDAAKTASEIIHNNPGWGS